MPTEPGESLSSISPMGRTPASSPVFFLNRSVAAKSAPKEERERVAPAIEGPTVEVVVKDSRTDEIVPGIELRWFEQAALVEKVQAYREELREQNLDVFDLDQAAQSKAFKSLASKKGFTVAPLDSAAFETYLASNDKVVQSIMQKAGLYQSKAGK